MGSESSSGAAGAAGVWKSGGHFSAKKKTPAATYPQVHGFHKSGGHFSGKKGACGNVPTSQGLPKIWGPFCWKKRRLRQRTHKSRASKNMGPFFAQKKAPAATYPQVKGFQKFGPLGSQAEKQGFRPAWVITGQKFP